MASSASAAAITAAVPPLAIDRLPAALQLVQQLAARKPLSDCAELLSLLASVTGLLACSPPASVACRQSGSLLPGLSAVLSAACQAAAAGSVAVLQAVLLALTAWLSGDPVGGAAFTAGVGLPAFLAPLIALPAASLPSDSWAALCERLAWLAVHHLPSQSLSPELSCSPAATRPLPLRPHLLLCEPSAIHCLLVLLPRTSAACQRSVLFWLLALDRADSRNVATLCSSNQLSSASAVPSSSSPASSLSCLGCLLSSFRPLLSAAASSLSDEQLQVRDAVWRLSARLLPASSDRRDVRAVTSLVASPSSSLLAPLLEAVQDAERRTERWPWVDVTGECVEGQLATGGWLEVTAASVGKEKARIFPPERGYSVALWLYVDEHVAHVNQAAASTTSGAPSPPPPLSTLFASPPSSFSAHRPPYLPLLSLLQRDKLRALFCLSAASHLTAVVQPTPSALRSSAPVAASFTSFAFHSHTWYHLTLLHTAASPSSLTMYVDGDFVQSLPLPYPQQSNRLLFGCWDGAVGGRLSKEAGRVGDVRLQARLGSALVSDLVLNDRQCQELYTSRAVHQPPAANGTSSESKPVSGDGSNEEEDWATITTACKPQWLSAAMIHDGEAITDSSAVLASSTSACPAPVAGLPLAVPLQHVLLYLHPDCASLVTSASTAPSAALIAQPVFYNCVNRCTPSPLLSDAVPRGSVYSHLPHSFISSYAEHGGLSHLLLLLSECSEPAALLSLLQLLLFLLSSSASVGAAFHASNGLSIVSSLLHDKPSLLTPAVLSVLYSLCGLSVDGQHGTIAYPTAFSLLFSHTLFLLPLPLALRIRLYQPLIAALLTNPQRATNVRVLREQGLVPFILSLLSARLVPLGEEASATADADGLSGDADVCEQLKGVLFLLFAEELLEKELREVTHFLLSDNERVVAATTFSASSVRGEAKVEEAIAGWRYDMAVKNSMLDLLLGVLLNSSLPPALLSPMVAASLSSVSSPPPKGKSTTKTASSPPPAAATASNASSPAAVAAPTNQSSSESLFTSLLQPSFLLALLAHIQSSYDRILSLLTQTHATSSEPLVARVDVNLPLRSVLYTLKLLITLTLRYPAYLQAMNQEMVWLALRDVLASPPTKDSLAADGAFSTKSSVSPFSGLVSGSGNVWGLLTCLLLGREVDGHVTPLPATRGSSPVRALVGDNKELANALMSVYGQCQADPRYRLHLHAREVLPLLLSMASTDSRFLLSTATRATSPPASALLRHFAEFMAVMVRDCEEARLYAAHSNGALMELCAIALLVHEQAAAPSGSIPQPVIQNGEVASNGQKHGKQSNGIPGDLNQADRSAQPAEQQHYEAVQGVQLTTGGPSTGPTLFQVPPIAADSDEVAAAPIQPSELITPTFSVLAAADDEQPPVQQPDSGGSPHPELSDGPTSTLQHMHKEQFTARDHEQHVHHRPASAAEEQQLTVDHATPFPAQAREGPTPSLAEFDANNAQPSDLSIHLDAPLTPSPPLASSLLSASDHSPFSSAAISALEDSGALVADDELSFSHTSSDSRSAVDEEQPGHRRGGHMGSLAEELMEAGEEEQQEEEAEAMRRYQQYQEEERNRALLEAERRAAEERRLQREREEAERQARHQAEARQRQLEDEQRRAREEEEERQRLQRLEEEAEAEVAAEVALEEEEERKKRAALLERQRAATEEKLRKQRAAGEERRRAEQEVLETLSPIPFNDAASQAVFGFLSQLLLLSLASPRPHTDSGASSDVPALHTRLDTGVQDYIVKTPHPSSTSDGRTHAFSLLFDMLHAPTPPSLVAWLSASAPVVHRQYCSQLLKVVVQQLLSSSDSFSALLLSSSAFSHNLAQVLCMLLSEVRCGNWRGEGVQLTLQLLGAWLRMPRFLSLLSAASAPPSQGKTKAPDDGRRSAKVALAVVHSILLVQYATALGLLARFVYPLDTAAASPLSRRGKRDWKLLEWCNDYLVQHKEPVLSVLVAREKHHAMVACLLYCLFDQLSEENERVCLTASAALSALLSSSGRSIPYVASLLSGKQSYTSSASFAPFPAHQLPVLHIGLSLLQRQDLPNFHMWRRDSYAALAASLRATLGASMEQWKAAREQQLQRHTAARSDELRRRDDDWRRRAAKEELERAEVAVRVRMLETSVKERRVKAEQDKRKEERKDKSINVRMQRKKLEMKRKEEELRQKREEELEKRRASRGITAAQWSAVANATQVDDSVECSEWRLKMPQAYQQQQQPQQQTNAQ